MVEVTAQRLSGRIAIVTGGASGIGEATARTFAAHGATVIIADVAAERGMALANEIGNPATFLALDVADPGAWAAVIDEVVRRFGRIDVLVNNAGIGLFGAFEATPMATVREVFETNTFGVMAMTQAVLPQFRERRWGVVVNVTSSVTLTPMPLAAAYTASKMAIEGFTGSLAHELEAFNVRVKLVEPGYGPNTRFASNVGSRMDGLFPEAYAAFSEPILASFAQVTAVTKESDVAEAVYRAANDTSGQLRFPAGADAVALARSL